FARAADTHGRPWVSPGAPGLAHRIGGLEKDAASGHISYDADNHQAMTQMRADKVASVARFVPDQRPELGPSSGRLAVIGWGSTYGPIWRAVTLAREEGLDVAHIHLRHLAPFPPNLGELLGGFDQVLAPEMNMGQLATVLRDRLSLDVTPLDKVSGQPFKISEILDTIRAMTGSAAVAAE
ncbi:MAG: hypothetical protein MI723_12670, partial [Caulobacterales bacterium]|nr:hypothetical protein [Caulobacterales bacterium]